MNVCNIVVVEVDCSMKEVSVAAMLKNKERECVESEGEKRNKQLNRFAITSPRRAQVGSTYSNPAVSLPRQAARPESGDNTTSEWEYVRWDGRYIHSHK